MIVSFDPGFSDVHFKKSVMQSLYGKKTPSTTKATNNQNPNVSIEADPSRVHEDGYNSATVVPLVKVDDTSTELTTQ